MDGVLDQLLSLEDAKRRALIEFDSFAYSEHVQAQNRIIADRSFPGVISPDSTSKLQELSELLRLNSALYQNLLSISPWIALARNGYTPEGQVAPASGPARFAVEV
jgi:hypothetical protein